MRRKSCRGPASLGRFTCTSVSPLVTIEYHKFSPFSIVISYKLYKPKLSTLPTPHQKRCDKLVFVGLRPKFPVIARPVRTLVVAIPRLEGKCIDNCPTERENLAIFGGNRYPVPFNGGIATPVCELARNDSISLQTPIFLPIKFLQFLSFS